MQKENLENKIKNILDEIRIKLQADGGDVEFVNINNEGIVNVKLIGSCAGCPMSQMTLKMHIEKYLKEKIPEIKEVRSI